MSFLCSHTSILSSFEMIRWVVGCLKVLETKIIYIVGDIQHIFLFGDADMCPLFYYIKGQKWSKEVNIVV